MNTDRILRLLTQIPGAKSLWSKYPFGSVDLRVRFGVWERPHYAYGCYHAADLAGRLGLKGITVIEMGVAGGRGLLALERIAGAIATTSGINIDVVGFDSGEGMPTPVDYRDLPYVWNTAFYKMDQDQLKARLSTAQIYLRNISKMITEYLASSAYT